MSGHDWSIDTIVHALPSPDLRQQCLREVHLAPLDELPVVVDKWRTIAVDWTRTQSPLIESARAHVEATGKLPAEHEETAESADRFDAWRTHMQQVRSERQAGAA